MAPLSNSIINQEGVTPLDNHHLLVIHDDDRRVGPALKRDLNQAVLQIVKIP